MHARQSTNMNELHHAPDASLAGLRFKVGPSSNNRK